MTPSNRISQPQPIDNLLGQLATLTVDQADRVFRDLHVSHPALASQLAARCVSHLASRVRILTTVDRPAGPLISDDAGFLSTLEPLQAGIGDTQIDDARTDFLGGRYRVIEELGRGAFGVVCLGEDTRTGQKVALKTMVKHGGRALEFFKGEFRYLQGIAHPNLVQLLELASDDHGWLIVMEFIEGTDFLAYVRPENSTQIDLDRLKNAFGQLVEGVHALHLHRRLHRDLKPQNVRVTPQGRVVVVDFGLAAEAGDGGEMRYADHSTPGTIPFMAPEQFDEHPVSSTASDLYSLGVMLRMALTGTLPYKGSISRIVENKITADPEPFRKTHPDVPEDLERLCLRLMARRPEDRPNADEVFAILGHQPRFTTKPGVSSDQTLLLGREPQLLALRDAYERVKAGHGAVVKLQGPSGIGKSALVARFNDSLDGGAVVLSGRCYEHESVPYKALDPVVDELTRHLNSLDDHTRAKLVPAHAGPLVKVFPALERVTAIALEAADALLTPDVHELRRLAFAGLRELLAKLAKRRPLVIHVDDLQWGDIDSAYLLADLCLPPDPPAILWILAHRSEDAKSPCLTNLAEALARVGVPVRDIDVLPLTNDETRELVQRLLGDQASEHADDIIRESGGNPYFVAELVQAVRAGDHLSADAKLTLDGLIRSRVAKLPVPARQLLEIVAVSGRPLGDLDAYQAADRINDPRTTAAQLESARLIRGIGEAGDIKLETYHDRVREAVIAGLDKATFKNHHGRLADVLEQSGHGDLEELAIHFEEGGLEEKAGSYYARAGDLAASSLAFEQAAGFFNKALDLSHLDAKETNIIRRKLADSLAAGGRGSEAGPTYLKIAENYSGLEKLELQRLAMEQLLVSGRTDEGMQIIKELFAHFGQKIPQGRWRRLLGMIVELVKFKIRGLKFKDKKAEDIPAEQLWKIDVMQSGGHHLSMIDTTLFSIFIFRVARICLNVGEKNRIIRCVSITAPAMGFQGLSTIKLAHRLRDFALGIRNKSCDTFTILYSTYNFAIINWCYGDWKSLLIELNDLEKLILTHNASFSAYETNIQHFKFDARMMLGEWADYAKYAKIHLESARRKGDLFATSMTLVHNYLPALMDGNPDAAVKRTEESWQAWPQSGNVAGLYWSVYGRTEASLYKNVGKITWKLLQNDQQFLDKSTHFKFLEVLNMLMLHLQGRAALAAAKSTDSGDGYFSEKSKFIRIILRLAKKIRRPNVPWANPLATLLCAGVANVRGKSADAIRLLSDAEIGFATVDMKMYAMASRRQRGRLVGGSEGEALVAQADAFMTNEGIREPVRIAGMLAPGFPD